MNSKPDGAAGRRYAALAARFCMGLAVPATLVVVWELLAGHGLLPIYLVAPSRFVATAVQLARSGDLWPHLGDSLLRVYSGFAIGTLAGAAAGLMAGIDRRANGFFDPLVALTYPMPKIALLPIFILWLGLGDASKIALITLASFYPTFISARQGAASADRNYLWAARNMGAGSGRIFFRVILPAALPQLFSGARIALAAAFVLLFAAEMIGASRGLGVLVVIGEDSVRFDLMFAAILTIALLGFASDRILVAVRYLVLVGQPR